MTYNPPLFETVPELWENFEGFYLLRGHFTTRQQEATLGKLRSDLKRDMAATGRGLESPVTRGGFPMSVRVWCWGLWWTANGYVEGVAPIPDWIRLAAIAVLNRICPAYPKWRPDTAILNFYDRNARLGEHRDAQESPQIILAGSPIVTFSFGESCVFKARPSDAYDKTTFEFRSGDVIVMEGRARSCLHEVTRILPGTTPIPCAGRVSLTVRQVR